MKKAVSVAVVFLLLFAGHTSPSSASSVPAASLLEATASSSAPPIAPSSSGSAVPGNDDPETWQAYCFMLQKVILQVKLPQGMEVYDMEEECSTGLSLKHDNGVVPIDIYDLTICDPSGQEWFAHTIYFLDAKTVNYLRHVGEGPFTFPDDLAGLRTETYTYSQTPEYFTYRYWGDYFVYQHPSPGVGGPYSFMVFIHLPTRMTFEFRFSGESIEDVFAYYSAIVSTAQYS